MSNYDKKVAYESGCEFISITMQDIQVYRKYRHILLEKYPKKEGMGWPTYLLVSDLEADFVIHGELKGGMQKGEFREKLNGLITAIK